MSHKQPLSLRGAESDAPSRRRLLALSMGSAMAAWLSSFLSGCGFGGSRGMARSSSDMAYRRVAANHLYSRYSGQVYRGMLPSMLHAVGTLDVYLGPNGQVRSLNWRRRPDHAPEVIASIESMVRRAAPFPSPIGGGTVYTDTWLWTYEGRFQLDSITEGQLRSLE